MNLLDQNLSPSAIQHGFESLGYICDESLALAVFLACKLDKPILVEGPPGVGKTELAKTTAAFFELPLIRLQCYEGLDESKALYEWKYGKQLLYTQVLKDKLGDLLKGTHDLSEAVSRLHDFGDIFYSEDFLEPRPLMQALRSEQGAVLLIDEVDKSDYEFEAFLLELLSDYQVSVPELGTITARNKPVVFLTSNNTRELGEALKRRCLHLYIPYPDHQLEARILAARVPAINQQLSDQLAAFVQSLRTLDLKKLPAVSETVDWAKALLLLNVDQLDPQLVEQTLNLLIKFQEDRQLVEASLPGILSTVRRKYAD